MNARQVLAGFLLVVSAASFAGHAAAAEVLVRVRLETAGELPPEQLCFVADYATYSKAEGRSWTDIAAPFTETRGAPAPGQSPDCPAPARHCPPQLSLTPTLANSELPKKHWCETNKRESVEKRALLYVANAVVMYSALDGTAVHLTLQPNKQTRGQPIVIQLLGGDYHGHTPISFTQLDGTQLLDLPLIPRCVQRDVIAPDYSCGNADTTPSCLSGAEVSVLPGSPRRFRANVHNSVQGRGRLELKQCGHSFSADWAGAVPPASIELQPERVWFEWQRNCLAPAGECPFASLQGVARLEKPERPGDDGVCRYEGSGKPQFPATVQFSYRKASVTRSWHEALTGPGFRLFGYIPEEQRRVSIQWPTDLDLQERRDWPQDALEYIELRTPEGRLHRVPFTAKQMRVPELDCNDALTYRYVGTRTFREEDAPVRADGRIEIRRPERSRADNFAIGAAVGGGWRHIGGTGDVSLGPQGEAQIVLIFRHLRDRLPVQDPALDVEVRLGAMISGQPFCSQLLNGVGDPDCGRDEWKRVPYWRFPITVGANLHFASGVTFGWGGGIAPTAYHWSRDMSRIRRRLLGAGRVHLGYHISRAWSIEAQLYGFYGERVREIQFDDAGIVQAGDRGRAQEASQMLGLLLRLDDVL